MSLDHKLRLTTIYRAIDVALNNTDMLVSTEKLLETIQSINSTESLLDSAFTFSHDILVIAATRDIDDNNKYGIGTVVNAQKRQPTRMSSVVSNNDSPLYDAIYSAVTNPLLGVGTAVIILLDDLNVVSDFYSEHPSRNAIKIKSALNDFNIDYRIEWTLPKLHPAMQEATKLAQQILERDN